MLRRRNLAVLLLALGAALPAAARTIQFSGLTWTVKSGVGGPGPNNWSDSTDSVWVDAQGRLHMKIRRIGSTWYCSEVITTQSFGYARYTMKMSSNTELLDPNAVVGFFTYKNDEEEIDIEFTRWGNAADVNTAQFAVQPSVPNTSSRVRFPTNFTGPNPPSTHSFTWTAESIYFQSYHGHADHLQSPADLIREHTYIGPKNPPLSNATLRINFWMFQGRTPTQEMEIIIDAVRVTPAGACTDDVDCDDGLFCNGAETCLDSVCELGPLPCTGLRQSCSEAADSCVCTGGGLRFEDLGWFTDCLQGPGLALSDACLCADLDGDATIDLRDFAIYQRQFVAAAVLFDFETGNQGWSSFGNGTISSGLTTGSSGQGRFHRANFDDPTMTYGFGDRCADGIDMSAFSGMGIDARVVSYDAAAPFVGTPELEFMLSIGYLEWAKKVILSDTYQTYTASFDELVPQGTATTPVSPAQLSDPGLRIKLIMRKAGKSGKVSLEYDNVVGIP